MAALVKFQSAMKAVKKGAINPFFKSKYADLASIVEATREPLAENGLAVAQFPVGENGLTTILCHSSGEFIEETFGMQPVDRKPQSVGSALTYMRRYALGAVLGIATEEDDDGNAASKPETTIRYDGPVAHQTAPRTKKPTARVSPLTSGSENHSDDLLGVPTHECSVCAEPISVAEFDFSMRVYKKAMCRKCQQDFKDSGLGE